MVKLQAPTVGAPVTPPLLSQNSSLLPLYCHEVGEEEQQGAFVRFGKLYMHTVAH